MKCVRKEREKEKILLKKLLLKFILLLFNELEKKLFINFEVGDKN